MRAFLELLRERHPGVTWIAAEGSKAASPVKHEAEAASKGWQAG
jgi:hypothetical protein